MKIKSLLLSIILTICITISKAQVLEQDSLALVAFYNSTGGPNWNNNANWLTGPVSTWYGLTVEGDRVTELILFSNNLIGTLPDELGEINSLYKITLSNNQKLTGDIPESIFNVDSLVWLAIGNCAYLKSISFRENFLTGLIPSDIGDIDSLQFLYLFDNQLSGPIPPELGNLENLEELRLFDNQLTGSIPPELANLNNIVILQLQNNFLTGNLPENFSCLFQNAINTISLDVSHNNLAGKLPESWGNMSFMIDALDISWNDFTYIPPVNYNWLITFFHIEGNKLTFEHIESHYKSYLAGLYYFFYYAPQQLMCKEIDTLLLLGSSYWIYSGTAGEYTNYEWYHNYQLIQQGPGLDTLWLENISYADTGIYYCYATNSLVNGLLLKRRNVHIDIDTGSSISEKQLQKQPLIYPNPANEEITVVMPFESEPVNFRIFNLEGKCVLTQRHTQINNSEIIAGIKGIKPGIYVLQVQTENSHYSTKLIINKRGAKQ
jgi:hypothetical protein